MTKSSAGILLFRNGSKGLEVFLVHFGGPLWAKKDAAAWSIPKGEFGDGEEPLAAAKREFAEETGYFLDGDFLKLDPVKQPNGKIVHAWAFQGDCDPTTIRSNTFSMEWPPKSGRQTEFPEIDRADFFDVDAVSQKINAAQMSFVDECKQIVREFIS